MVDRKCRIILVLSLKIVRGALLPISYDCTDSACIGLRHALQKEDGHVAAMLNEEPYATPNLAHASTISPLHLNS
jgi:hypothetical protein